VARDAVDLPVVAMAVGGTLTTAGFLVFATNVLVVLRGHSPFALRTVLLAGLDLSPGK
jgi:hypothetical protein